MWGDPGITQTVMIQEAPLGYPNAAGGNAVRTLQRAGLLKKLRFWAVAALTVSAQTTAATKSTLGPLGAYLSRIRVNANGQIPLYDLSGYGATVYNEVSNRDGSVLATPPFLAVPNVTAAAALTQFDATSVATIFAKYPFEFQFSLPVNIRQAVTELGLWLLQNQAIDVSVEVNFNPLYQATANNAILWSAGTGITAVADLTQSKLNIERELYEIPGDPKDYPNLAWTHQVIEFTVPFTSNTAIFNIPRAGLLLRAIVNTVDGSGNPVEYTDISSLSWLYGANENPINRPGWAMVQEFLQDFNRYPPKGTVVLDFYKWGWEGLKLVKDTEQLANLRIQTNYAATASGTQTVILDRLVPVVSRPA